MEVGVVPTVSFFVNRQNSSFHGDGIWNDLVQVFPGS